tara:strand:+ start:8399 stop:9070 length:672 start_codon:yes stop_codon:yes gene_type:complete
MQKIKQYISLLIILILGNYGCQSQTDFQSEFLKDGYMVFEEIYGDLNNDGLEDCVLIIKATDSKNVVVNRFDDKVDRNRRGIIILFKKDKKYNSVIKNYDCFYSENEDGGAYFPPELSVYIKNGKLYLHYSHGRYGYWKYTFRFKNSDFELIGYDASDNFGPIVNKETSINFLIKKKLTKENTNENADGGDEIFKETWKKIEIEELIKLSNIKDFYELDMSKY